MDTGCMDSDYLDNVVLDTDTYDTVEVSWDTVVEDGDKVEV